MNLVKHTSWLNILTNVALLAGMVLVAFEINQNSQLARTALVNEGNIASNAFWANLMGETPADVIAGSDAPGSKLSGGEDGQRSVLSYRKGKPVCRPKRYVASTTFRMHHLRKKYRGMETEDIRRLKQLEAENQKLKFWLIRCWITMTEGRPVKKILYETSAGRLR